MVWFFFFEMTQKRSEAFFQRPEEETVSWLHRYSSEEVCIPGNPSQDLLRGAEWFIPGSLRQEVSEPWGKLKLTPGGPVWPLPIPPLPSPLLHPLLFLKKKKKSLLLFVCTGSLSRRACSLVFAVVCKTATCYSRTPSCGGGIWLPDQGLNLGPLHWELGILATGPEGKFPSFLLSFFLLSAFKSCSPFLLFLSFPFIKNDREDFPSYASFS